jgi:hypothetical protein
MRKSFFIFILLFVSYSIAAQKAKTENKWTASLTGAIIPLPEFNAGIQPGINYQFSDRLSLLTEITIRVGNKADKDSEAVNKKYFRIQPELRYNFFNKKRKRNDYAGLRLSYAVRKFADINKGFYAIKRPGDDGFFYDKANINSPVITSSIQFGTMFSAGKKLSIDLFTGIGARFIKTAYTDVVNPIKGMRSRPADGPVFYASYSYDGNLTMFYLNAGLRLMYHFR